LNPAWSPQGRDDGWLPALAAAAVLHVLVFTLVVMFGLPKLKPGGASVPINIVANAPARDSHAAEPAPEPQPAATEEPVPEAPPAPPAAKSVPVPPVPPKPAPRPVPTPAPAKTAPLKAQPPPTPAPPHPAKPAPAQPAFDLDKLQTNISKYATKSAPPRPSGGLRGPPRVDRAPPTLASGSAGPSNADVEGLGQLLNRLWNPNCAADPVDVDLAIDVDLNGRIRVDAHGRDQSSDPAVAASYIRAVSAVHKVEPYDPKFRGQHIPIRFIASKACANR
jgi:outer membrane biosynthesis protein TonB